MSDIDLGVRILRDSLRASIRERGPCEEAPSIEGCVSNHDQVMLGILRWVLGAETKQVAAWLAALECECIEHLLLVGTLSATYPLKGELGAARVTFANRARPVLAAEIGEERTANIYRRLGP